MGNRPNTRYSTTSLPLPKGGTGTSSGSHEPRTIEPFDLPALFAGMGTPNALRVVSDFAAGLAVECVYILVVHRNLLSCGSPTPFFSAVFRPVCRFQSRGGILTLPQRRNSRTGATAGLPLLNLANYEHYGNFKARFFARSARFPRAGHTIPPAPYRASNPSDRSTHPDLPGYTSSGSFSASFHEHSVPYLQ